MRRPHPCCHRNTATNSRNARYIALSMQTPAIGPRAQLWLKRKVDAVQSHIHVVAHGAQDPGAVRAGGPATPAGHSSLKSRPCYRGAALALAHFMIVNAPAWCHRPVVMIVNSFGQIAPQTVHDH